MDSYTDIELVSLAQGGQARALEHLFAKHYMAVYSLAYRWCGVKEDAEDIAQEVFVKLVRKLHTFSQKSSFKTWLYRIAVNTAKDFGRKKVGRQRLEADFVREQSLPNPTTSGQDTVEAAQLMAAIGKLPLKQKEAVLLVFGEGFSHKETSKVLGCAETTVSWRIFQAKKRLKKFLEQET
jgi:RNA polymerase sigma-70 factor (ECF subfamily)